MTYKWDTEDILTAAGRLEQQKEDLDKQRESLEKYKGYAAGGFQGDAGTQFQENLETDIRNMKLVADMLAQQAERLRSAANNHYTPCEDNIRAKISEVAGSMK